MDKIKPWRRPLLTRTADTREGNEVLCKARLFSWMPRYAHLTDGELIRLAYWGASGDPDNEGRKTQLKS